MSAAAWGHIGVSWPVGPCALDYLVIPLINTVYCALTLREMVPVVPYLVWTVLFVIVITALNLGGIRATARANIALLAVMTVVIVAFVALAIRYLVDSAGWESSLVHRAVLQPSRRSILNRLARPRRWRL